MVKYLYIAAIAGAASLATPASASLLVNGNFEASTSSTMTPPGWTNIGHSDGVIAYSQFSTPAYDGNYYYDLGGFGDPTGPVGDGIEQTVATQIGSLYRLTFGLSSEDVRGTSRLDVLIGSGALFQTTAFTQGSTGTFLGKGFTTQTINFLATSSMTTIRFIEGLNDSGGNNDPMIDGVSFELARAVVPEPASWALMIAGVAGVGGAMRRRRSVTRSVAFA